MSELEPEEIAKCVGQFALALNGIMKPLRLYGQGHYVDMASQEIVSLAWQLHWKLEGIDMPYEVTNLRW